MIHFSNLVTPIRSNHINTDQICSHRSDQIQFSTDQGQFKLSQIRTNCTVTEATLTGFLCTSSWLLATPVNQMMVIIEFKIKEKKRFLCRVILWQLKFLPKIKTNNNKKKHITSQMQRTLREDLHCNHRVQHLLKMEKYPE